MNKICAHHVSMFQLLPVHSKRDLRLVWDQLFITYNNWLLSLSIIFAGKKLDGWMINFVVTSVKNTQMSDIAVSLNASFTSHKHWMWWITALWAGDKSVQVVFFYSELKRSETSGWLEGNGRHICIFKQVKTCKTTEMILKERICFYDLLSLCLIVYTCC